MLHNHVMLRFFSFKVENSSSLINDGSGINYTISSDDRSHSYLRNIQKNYSMVKKLFTPGCIVFCIVDLIIDFVQNYLFCRTDKCWYLELKKSKIHESKSMYRSKSFKYDHTQVTYSIFRSNHKTICNKVSINDRKEDPKVYFIM